MTIRGSLIAMVGRNEGTWIRSVFRNEGLPDFTLHVNVHLRVRDYVNKTWYIRNDTVGDVIWRVLSTSSEDKMVEVYQRDSSHKRATIHYIINWDFFMERISGDMDLRIPFGEIYPGLSGLVYSMGWSDVPPVFPTLDGIPVNRLEAA